MFNWGILCWCSSKIELVGEGGNLAKFAITNLFHFSYFLSCINITYLKRTNFSHKIGIYKNIVQSYNRNFEKNQIFFLAIFHKGVLFSKTLNAISRVKKLIKFFNFWFFVMVLTQTMRKSCIWNDFFSLGGKCSFGTVYSISMIAKWPYSYH